MKERIYIFYICYRTASSVPSTGQARTLSRELRYVSKILYEIMLVVVLCLTKPAFMRHPWRITPCPAVHGRTFLCFMCIISTVSKRLRYSRTRKCACLSGARNLQITLSTQYKKQARQSRTCLKFKSMNYIFKYYTG